MAKNQSVEISILEIYQGEVEFLIKGTSPLIFHRMGEKAKRELLFPKGRKTAADKAANLKHNPIEEYRETVYRSNKPETQLMVPSAMFKASMANAALDIPGATKAQMGRLVWVLGDEVPIYGVPELFMSIVRSSDMNRTPDIRTRAIVPKWACSLKVRFIKPNINDQSVINLIAAAGVITGIGDYRQQKGKSSYGQFELVGKNDKDYRRIIKEGGRAPQEKALESPAFYDYDSEELYNWFYDEFKTRRGEADLLKLVEGGKD
jgi:hypothetical protein